MARVSDQARARAWRSAQASLPRGARLVDELECVLSVMLAIVIGPPGRRPERLLGGVFGLHGHARPRRGHPSAQRAADPKQIPFG